MKHFARLNLQKFIPFDGIFNTPKLNYLVKKLLQVPSFKALELGQLFFKDVNFSLCIPLCFEETYPYSEQ